MDGATATQQVAVNLISTGAVVVEAGDGQHGSESVEEAEGGRSSGLHCGYDTTDGDHGQSNEATSNTADRGKGVSQVIENGDGHLGVGLLEGIEAGEEAGSGGGHCSL